MAEGNPKREETADNVRKLSTSYYPIFVNAAAADFYGLNENKNIRRFLHTHLIMLNDSGLQMGQRV